MKDIPAFPCAHPDFATFGMTLRDYFAAKAMQGMLASGDAPPFVIALVKHSYVIAEEMLAAREEK